ncbi:hypothetical protein SCOR_08165 [Sulfidibacter corallicola]|uniref:Uncharacterized protein n=1 Tax=Sulfidibacter corallicola TaxID=2818388 RepID=A0A8A4TQ00_SULCO|nr:hypothetical protein [Sulfidibacter corallicola]QTD51264.1 hypothetical protein J3U87_02250 [Sulfidibacter corallicola]
MSRFQFFRLDTNFSLSETCPADAQLLDHMISQAKTESPQCAQHESRLLMLGSVMSSNQVSDRFITVVNIEDRSGTRRKSVVP